MKVESRHHQAIMLRMAGYTFQAIAEGLGVKIATVESWFGDAEVKKEYVRYQQVFLDIARKQMAGMLTIALEKTRNLLQSKHEASVRRACEMVFRLNGLYQAADVNVFLRAEQERESSLPVDPIERIKALMEQLRNDLDLPPVNRIPDVSEATKAPLESQ